MGNLGKATSFVDVEGDGDVMPKLVDMLTKVQFIELQVFRLATGAFNTLVLPYYTDVTTC